MKLYHLARIAQSGTMEGRGSMEISGRWHFAGTPCIYACASKSLCMVEMRAPNDMKLPEMMYATYEVPEESIQVFRVEDLPEGWNSWPRPIAAREFGDARLKELNALILSFPSAVFPDERIYIINPKHPLMKEVQIISCEPLKN